jgi:hypothetical protein
MIDVNITVPASDVAAIQATFNKYVAWFNKGPKEAVKKTCVYIVRSLRASTKIGAKVRRIVKNPDYAKTGSKRERQLMHIAEWNAAHGRPVRMPQAFQKYAIQRYWQGGIDHRAVNGNTSAEARTAAAALDTLKGDRSNIYRIAKRGLAKASWGWMLGKLGKRSAPSEDRISERVGLTQVTESTGSDLFVFIDIANKLKYIRKATKANVGSVIARANRAMIDEMEGHVKSARQQSGLRAA